MDRGGRRDHGGGGKWYDDQGGQRGGYQNHQNRHADRHRDPRRNYGRNQRDYRDDGAVGERYENISYSDFKKLKDKEYMASRVHRWPGSASLHENVDERNMVVLRDGKVYFGVIKSYDNYANISAIKVCERIFVGNKFGEKKYKGALLVRGENIMLIKRISEEEEKKKMKNYEKIPFLEAKEKYQIVKEARNNLKPVFHLKLKGEEDRI